MAHCHPLMMVQRIHQVPDLQLALQAHAPDTFVLLALTQQHPNSQHLMKKPRQSLAAVVLTKDQMCVGTSIGPANQVEKSAFAAGVCSLAQKPCIRNVLVTSPLLQQYLKWQSLTSCHCIEIQAAAFLTMLCSFRSICLSLRLPATWQLAWIYRQEVSSGTCTRYLNQISMSQEHSSGIKTCGCNTTFEQRC